MTAFLTYEILIGAEDVYFHSPKALLYISDLYYSYLQSKPDLTTEKTSQLHFDYQRALKLYPTIGWRSNIDYCKIVRLAYPDFDGQLLSLGQ